MNYNSLGLRFLIVKTDKLIGNFQNTLYHFIFTHMYNVCTAMFSIFSGSDLYVMSINYDASHNLIFSKFLLFNTFFGYKNHNS
jgi:hypothetical protein